MTKAFAMVFVAALLLVYTPPRPLRTLSFDERGLDQRAVAAQHNLP